MDPVRQFLVKLSVTEETSYFLPFGWSLIMSVLSVTFHWLLHSYNHTSYLHMQFYIWL